MAQKKNDTFNIEQAFVRLGEINTGLENPQTSLKESMELYTEGVKLVTACKEELAGVEKEIQVLDEL